VNLKKGLPQPGTWPGYLADTRQKRANNTSGRAQWQLWQMRYRGVVCNDSSKHASSIRSVWAALCGRLGVNAEALTMLRGPIRRRPYNRGEIVAKNAKEMGVFYDFY
jgi:hypothetical protein